MRDGEKVAWITCLICVSPPPLPLQFKPMGKHKSRQKLHLDVSKTQFNLIKRIILRLAPNPTTNDLVCILMDAQEDYFRRVASERKLPPQPAIPKHPLPPPPGTSHATEVDMKEAMLEDVRRTARELINQGENHASNA